MLVSPQVADEDVALVSERVRKYVTEHGGSIQELKPWGRRRLAYHIGNFQEANYVQFNFSLDPEHARELEQSLHLAEDVIRHLLVLAEIAKPAPAAAAPSPAGAPAN